MMGITGNLKSGTLADTHYKKIVCSEKNPNLKWDKVVIFRGWNSPTPTDKSPCSIKAGHEKPIGFSFKHVYFLSKYPPPPE